jgi:hypothetical protein
LSTALRNTRLALLVTAALAGAAAPAAAQPEPPPPSSLVCPGIEEDGLLCADDLMSGNCEDFVTKAAQLGALYRTEVQERPDARSSLLTTNWWGCGPNSLGDVKALLQRIGTLRALAVLKDEPFSSLAGPLPPPPTVGAQPTLQCDELSDPSERSACMATRLQAAQASHQQALEACQKRVPPGLRDDLAQAEATFKAILPVRCDAQAAGMDDQDSKTFIRSRCQVVALEDNTRGMLAAHPECAAQD